ncbi:protein kinase [Achlya hypogyna]|uniref:Protein kinase n=1 Tax=Achlya hypogyna TaxID=1202772 RepID=A0A1V9YM64_ACHHY|nr:protein kinase [Achlya hypogyna]
MGCQGRVLLLLLAAVAVAQDMIMPTCVVPSVNTLTSACYGSCNETSANTTTASCLIFKPKDTALGCSNQKRGLCHDNVGPNKCMVLCLQQLTDVWTFRIGVPDPNDGRVGDIEAISGLVVPAHVSAMRFEPRDRVDFPEATIALSETSIKAVGGLRNLSIEQLLVPNVSALSIYPNLTALQLKQVKLTVDQVNSIIHVTTIESLDLSNNGLTTIPGNVFSMTALQALNLAGNPLSSVILNPNQEAFLRSLRSFVGSGALASPCPPGAAARQWNSLAYCFQNTTTLATRQPVMVEASTLAPTTLPAPEASNRGYTVYLVAGLVCLFVLGLIFYVVLFRSKRRPVAKKLRSATLGDAVDEASDVEMTTFVACASVRPSDPCLATARSSWAATLSMRSLHHEIAAKDVDVPKTKRILLRHSHFDMFEAKVLGAPVYLTRLLPLTHDRALSLLSMLSTLRHPRLMNVLGVVWRSVDDLPLGGVQMDVALEFLDGGALEDYVLARPAMTWRHDKMRMALEIALGLLQVHDHDFVYNGLTGKTVFVDSTHGCKLHTLALVDDVAIDGDQHTTEDRIFLAPEVLAGDLVTSASDMYAFGVLLMLLDAALTPWQLSRRTWIRTVADATALPAQPGVDFPSLLGSYEFDQANCPAIINAVAKSCVHPDPSQRPSASFAYAMIRKDFVAS